MSDSFEMDAPDHFTVGAVGQPGDRIFYLQGRQKTTVVTLKCEKQQVNALAEYLAGLLVRVAIGVKPAESSADLVEPVEPAWAIASIGVGWDEGERKVVIIASATAQEQEEEEEEDAEGAAAGQAPTLERPSATPAAAREEGPTARFSITPAQAQAFIDRARAVVRAGRPTCPMCGQTREAGHLCPRANGHVVR